MLVKDQQKFGAWLRVRQETLYAFFLGSIPTFIGSSSSELQEIVKILLTSPILMEYYTILLGLFMAVSIVIFKTRFRSASYNRMMRETHTFLVNIGGSLLMAFRMALGAMIGFLMVWCYRDLGTMSLSGIFTTASYALMTLSVCVILSWMDETLKTPHALSRYS